MAHVRHALRWLLAAAWCLATSLSLAQPLLEVPTLSSRVIDQTGSLSPEQRQAMVDKLAAFESRKGSQIAVLIVPSTQPEDIAAYTNRVANAWKIGRKGVGDGLLLVVARNDRKLRIEVAKSLEGAITDLQAKRVIDQDITPSFKQGDYAGGVGKGIDALIKLVDNEALPAPADTGETPTPETGWDVLQVWLWIYFVLGGLILGGAGIKRGLKITGFFAASSATLGFPTWFFTHDGGAASGAAFIAIPLALVIYGGINGKRVSGSTKPSTKPWNDPSPSSIDWSSSSSDSSSSSSDSFSSGGGGDFGGGGASGDW